MDKRGQYIDKQIIEQIMELRKQLHRIPEHSMQEVKTKQLLMDFLKSHTALEIVDCGAWFYAVKRAKNKGSVISYDPNYRASLWPDEETAKKHMRSLVPYVDLMKISDEETELLTGHKDVREAAEALYSQGVKVVAVTLGGEGAYLYSKDGGCVVPGFVVEQIADTNGAGDSFWGGFLYKVSTSEKYLDELTQEELKEFARFGNAVASLCVEKKGAIPAMPELAQVEERMGF